MTARKTPTLALARDVDRVPDKCAFEALSHLTLIPVSLAAPDRPVARQLAAATWFHTVAAVRRACERRIDLWGGGRNAGVAERRSRGHAQR